jgi:hypothetical protein
LINNSGGTVDVLLELTGWIGAAAILVGYLSVSMGWLRPGRRFQLANLVGSCAFIVNGAFHEAWPSVVTNVAWFLISVVALLRTPPKVAAAEEALGAGLQARD